MVFHRRSTKMLSRQQPLPSIEIWMSLSRRTDVNTKLVNWLPYTSSAPSSNCFFHWVIWFGCTSKRCASSARVCSPFKAASATFDLNLAERIFVQRHDTLSRIANHADLTRFVYRIDSAVHGHLELTDLMEEMVRPARFEPVTPAFGVRYFGSKLLN